MKKTIFLLLLSVISASCAAAELEIQYEGDAAYTSVKSDPSIDPDGSGGLLVNSDLHSRLRLNDDLVLTLDHRLHGFNCKDVLPETNVSTDNFLSGGLFLSIFGNFQAVLSNWIYGGADALAMPYYQFGSESIPKNLTTFDIGWGGEFEWFHTDLQLTSVVNNFKLQPQDRPDTTYGNRSDADLWGSLNAGADISSLDMEVNGGCFFKSDLSGNDYYNYSKYWIGCNGDHNLNRNRLMLSWELQEQFIQSTILDECGYSDGLTTDLLMRMIWRKSADFFVKGQIRVDIASKLFKQFYELQLRKTWGKGSSLDVSYFATNGVLFPRQGLGVTSTLRLFRYLGVNPGFAFYFMQLPNKSAISYYRSDYKLELLFPVHKRIDLFAGMNIMLYNDHPLFATRNTISAGIRTW